jgi:hypothetical protein
MGEKQKAGAPVMTRVCWWFVDLATRLLEPAERDVIRGDIEERGESSWWAIRDVTGLVFRRQVDLWDDRQPWVSLICLVVPFGMLLSLLARWFAEGSAIYSFLYVSNWTWGFVAIPGARRDLLDHSLEFLLDFAGLFCWSWTTGFVLGALSRRTAWVNGILLVSIVCGEFLLIPQPHNPVNAAVFDLTFYDVVFPALFRIAFIAVPIYRGLRKGSQRATFPLHFAMLWAVAVVLLTTRAADTVQTAVTLSWWRLDSRPSLIFDSSWSLRLLPFVLAWPAAYMLGTAGWKRWRSASV